MKKNDDIIKKDRKALLIVDMIKAFVDSSTIDGDCKLYIPKAESLIPNINREISKLSDEDLIIHVNDWHEENDKEFEMFPVHALAYTEEVEIADGFDYGGKSFYTHTKTRFSGFFSRPSHKSLMSYLMNKSVTELIIVGVCTDICVMYTAADARFRDFKVTIPRDCVAGTTVRNNSWALAHMQDILGVKINWK